MPRSGASEIDGCHASISLVALHKVPMIGPSSWGLGGPKCECLPSPGSWAAARATSARVRVRWKARVRPSRWWRPPPRCDCSAPAAATARSGLPPVAPVEEEGNTCNGEGYRSALLWAFMAASDAMRLPSSSSSHSILRIVASRRGTVGQILSLAYSSRSQRNVDMNREEITKTK